LSRNGFDSEVETVDDRGAYPSDIALIAAIQNLYHDILPVDYQSKTLYIEEKHAGFGRRRKLKGYELVTAWGDHLAHEYINHTWRGHKDYEVYLMLDRMISEYGFRNGGTQED
jgi:hypothetical protein